MLSTVSNNLSTINGVTASSRLKRARTWAKRLKAFREASEKSSGKTKAKYNRIAKKCEKNMMAEAQRVLDILQNTLTTTQYEIFERFVMSIK